MYLISDYFSFVAGNAARGTVHEHATFRGSPHIYSRRTITLTATNNQYIVDFDVFMDLLRETKKMWESKLSLGRNIYRCFLFFLCIYLYFLLRKSGLNLFSVCLWCQEMTAEWDTFASVLKPSCFLLSWFSSLLMTLSLWRSQTTRTVLCDAYRPSFSVDCNFQLELLFP